MSEGILVWGLSSTLFIPVFITFYDPFKGDLFLRDKWDFPVFALVQEAMLTMDFVAGIGVDGYFHTV